MALHNARSGASAAFVAGGGVSSPDFFAHEPRSSVATRRSSLQERDMGGVKRIVKLRRPHRSDAVFLSLGGKFINF